MNIIFLEAAQNLGGARKSTIELASRLIHKDINVFVVDFYGTCKEFIDELENCKLDYSILKKREVPFILSNKNKIIKLKNYLYFAFERIYLKYQLKGIISNLKPDFIFVSGYKTLSILPKTKSCKTVFFARGWYIKSQISRRDKVLLKNKVDLFLAVSQSTRQALFCNQIAELNRIYVVKNGITLKSFPKDIKKNSKLTLLHSGGFLPSKGHHISVEISKKLKNIGIDHILYLTGKIYEGPDSVEYYYSILDKIEKYNLEEHVKIVTNKNNIQPYFEKAHIFIHPSDTEGLPRVVMEAMANNCTVIANGVGGVTDFILDGFTGYIADYNNVDSYVSIIKYIVNNPESNTNILNRAYSLIENCYTENNQLKNITRILETEIINK